jgi:hypothetical protein
VLPALVWAAVAVGGSLRRPEGDLLITGGGATGTVNLAFLLLGVVAAAFGAGRVLAGPRPVRPPAPSPVSPERAGSGTGGAR